MELVIFGKNIKVLKKKNLINNNGVAGFYEYKTKNITIDSSLKDNDFNQTLIHELIHATFDRLGFINTNIDANLEELIADNIAVAICENCKIKWNTVAKDKKDA